MRYGLLALGVLFAAGCGDDSMGPVDQGIADLGGADMAVPDLGGNASAARGEVLVKHLLFCGRCHTTPDANGQPSTAAADFLAGGRSFTVAADADAGSASATVYAPNLTPDDQTGVGTWSLSQIADAIKVGVDDQGLPLWPTMPYPRFGNLTDDDAMSIALYLKSLPPQHHQVPEDSAHPALASPRLDFKPIPHTTLPSSDALYASAERGRYLADVACLSCHTPSGPPPLGLDVAKAYAGGRPFTVGNVTVQSANLTPDASGLGGWTAADVVATLETDRDKGTGAQLCKPMPGGPDGFGGLPDGDLTDLANYVHTLPAVANGPFSCPDGGL